MKNILTLFIASFVLSLGAFTQSQYSTINNRVIISTVVNGDTIIVENTQNKVRLNGELELFHVEYDNYEARLVTGNGNIDSDERSDMIIEFFNEYSWLDEQLKTTQPVNQFTDELHVKIEDIEQTIPVDFLISRFRVSNGFTVIIQVSGNFSGKDLEDDFPNLKFESELHFVITLTVQVTE